MRPSEIKESIKVLIKAKLNAFVTGSPGLGKSDIIKSVGTELGLKVIDVRSSLLDSLDLRGVPYTKDGITHWAQPCFLPREPKCLLFFDELPQAPQMVQSALLQLTLDRRCGEYVLPEDCIVIAAGNKSSDRAGTHKIITPLLNRFVHLDFEANIDDWLAWAGKNDIDSNIQYFLKWKPDQLNNFDATLNQRSFATPRSWSFVSSIIKNSDRPISDLVQIIEGAVGSVSAEFVAFVRLKDRLPDIEQIMRDPENAPVPSAGEPGVMYALIGALDEKLKDKANYDSYFKYIARIQPDFSVMSYKQCATKYPDIKTNPFKQQWYKNVKHLFTND